MGVDSAKPEQRTTTPGEHYENGRGSWLSALKDFVRERGAFGCNTLK